MVTATPARAARSAAISPAGPAPITTHVFLLVIGAVSDNLALRWQGLLLNIAR
jgi:hypothetical protein